MRTKVNVYFYRQHNGTEPVRDWLKSALSDLARKSAGTSLRTVQFGWPVGMPLVRKIETELWELRVRIPEGIARIFFTVLNNELILLHGFIKKSAKIPLPDLLTARRRLSKLRQ